MKKMPSRRAREFASLLALGSLLLSPPVALAGSTGSVRLYFPQGAAASTAVGDYVGTTGGLNTFFSYFIEVPPTATRLVVDVFDADVGASGGTSEQDAQRDRRRTGTWDTSMTYTLLEPTGTTINSITGDAAGPAGADNAWLALYDSQTTAPSFTGSTTAVSAAGVTSIALNAIAGTVAGDFLMAVIMVDGTANVAPPADAVAWTTLDEGNTPTGDARMEVFYKIAGTAEPASYAFTWTGAEQVTAALLRYINVNPTTPINVSAAGTGTDATLEAPSVTTTAANTRVVRLWGYDDDRAAPTFPAGVTSRFAIESQNDGNDGGGNADDVSSAGADAAQAVAGASGTSTLTIDGNEDWRAVTVALARGGNARAGHWEVRVDSLGGNNLNAFGLRAHDGTPGAGGVEIPIYYDSHTAYGVNPLVATGTNVSKTYDVFPWITAGCYAYHNDFDWDQGAADYDGAVIVSGRVGQDPAVDYAQTFTGAQLSGNNVWDRDLIGTSTTAPYGSFVTDSDAINYGIWDANIRIETYTTGTPEDNGNYGHSYFARFNVGANPPTQPMPNAFRVYLPADASDSTAPVKPYVEQFGRYCGGAQPPAIGQLTCMTVTVRVTNPTARPIAFSTPSNIVTANVPGGAVVYRGNPQVSQGSIVSQPAIGGSGNVTWNPGSVAAGATALLSYELNVTPAVAGRLPITGLPTGANGTRAQYLDETANSAQARATYLFGPLCELAVTPGVTTRALVYGFAARTDGRQTIVEWRTGSEDATATFQLYRHAGKPGWVPVGDGRPLTAVPGASAGATYRVADDAVRLGQTAIYSLVETEANGRQIGYGPFTVKVQSAGGTPSPSLTRGGGPPAPALEAPGVTRRPMGSREIARLAAANAELGRPAGAGARGLPTAKALLRDDGLYAVSAAQLAELFGQPAASVASWIASGGLRLSQGGSPVAYLPAADGSALYFFGQGLDSAYSRDNVYWIQRGSGLLMQVGGGTAPGGAPATAFVDDKKFEQERFPVTVLNLSPESDYWFWEYLVAGDPGDGSRQLALEVSDPNPSGGAATLTVELQGATDSGVADEHQARIRWNGNDLGTIIWEGVARQIGSFPVPAASILPGTNQLEVVAELGAGVGSSIFYLDSASLSYSRQLKAVGDRLLFSPAGAGDQIVTGFSSPDLALFQLADPRRPLRVPATVGGGAGNYSLSFRPSGAGQRYLAVRLGAASAVASLAGDVPSNLLRSPGADYLIVAPAGLAQGAEALADYRRAAGHSVLVASLEDLYDEVNFGIADPRAIAGFLRAGQSRWSVLPRFLALLGEGTFDYKDHLGVGGNYVPALMVATPRGLYGSDARHADLDGDGDADLAVGRIPVASNDEAIAYIAKLAAYESAARGSWVSDLTLLADDGGSPDLFSGGVNLAGGSLPSTYRLERLFAGQIGYPAARSALFSSLAAGRGLVNYIGHGGLDRLASEGLLTSDDVATLGNAGRPTLLFAGSCSIGRFELPGYPSLAELLVREPLRGAVAVWSPSGLSENAAAVPLNRELAARAFTTGGSLLGSAWQAAAAAYLAAGGDAGLLSFYNLIGDPALRLSAAPASAPVPPSKIIE